MFSFSKKEHLCGDKNIERLYKDGKSLLVYPLRVVFLVVENESVPVRVMVSVSKKKFKRAVKRNRVKRLTREAYRLNKNELIDFSAEKNIQLHIAFQYIATDIENFQKVNEKIQIALRKIIQNLKPINESIEKNS